MAFLHRSVPWLAAAAAVFAFGQPADAAVTGSFFGEGFGRDCYLAADAGRPDAEAFRVCDLALGTAMSPRDRAATYVNRGVLSLQRRDGPTALADITKALRLAPELAEAHVNHGAALILTQDYDAAIAAISRGIALGAEKPEEAYFNRALAHEKRENLRAAYADYRRAAELAPAWPLPQAELARFTVRPAAQ